MKYKIDNLQYCNWTREVFEINRLGLSDTFEAGRSVTLGLDYKKENIF